MSLLLNPAQPVAGPLNGSSLIFSDLFAQLGLPTDDAAIAQFLLVNATLAKGMRLTDAPCWTPSQAAFLKEAWMQDAEWSCVVDQLNRALLSPPSPAGAPIGQIGLR